MKVLEMRLYGNKEAMDAGIQEALDDRQQFYTYHFVDCRMQKKDGAVLFRVVKDTDSAIGQLGGMVWQNMYLDSSLLEWAPYSEEHKRLVVFLASRMRSKAWFEGNME